MRTSKRSLVESLRTEIRTHEHDDFVELICSNAVEFVQTHMDWSKVKFDPRVGIMVSGSFVSMGSDEWSKYSRHKPKQLIPKPESLISEVRISLERESPIYRGDKWLVGFWDVQLYANIYVPSLCVDKDHLEWKLEHKTTLTIGVEVKTDRPSLGDLLRQLRMYMEFDPQSRVVVVCKPNSINLRALDEEGIGSETVSEDGTYLESLALCCVCGVLAELSQPAQQRCKFCEFKSLPCTWVKR